MRVLGYYTRDKDIYWNSFYEIQVTIHEFGPVAIIIPQAPKLYCKQTPAHENWQSHHLSTNKGLRILCGTYFKNNKTHMELSQPISLMFPQGNSQVSPPDSTYPVADFDSGIKIDLISTSSKIQIKPCWRVPWAPCIKDFASECNRNCATISSPDRFWPGEGLMSANCIKITWRPTQPFLRTKHPTRRLWISICPVLITGSGRGCGVVYPPTPR